MTRMTSRALLVSVVCMLVAACGGAVAAGGAMRPFSKLTAQDVALFEDGVDFVAEPGALTGAWADDAARELRGRVERGDLVATVTVSTLQTQIDPQQRTTFRLSIQVLETLKGKAPADLALVAAQDAVGYATLEPARSRLLSERFVAFVKWYEKPDGTVGAHFHLSIASQDVLSRIRAEIDRGQPSGTTILKTRIVED